MWPQDWTNQLETDRLTIGFKIEAIKILFQELIWSESALKERLYKYFPNPCLAVDRQGLCRPDVGDRRSCEIGFAMARSCPKDSISQPFSLSFSSQGC